MSTEEDKEKQQQLKERLLQKRRIAELELRVTELEAWKAHALLILEVIEGAYAVSNRGPYLGSTLYLPNPHLNNAKMVEKAVKDFLRKTEFTSEQIREIFGVSVEEWNDRSPMG